MTAATRRRRPVGQRGSMSLELAVLAPSLLLLLSFAIWAGRTQIADNAVEEAARAAAREASIALDPDSATAAAQSEVSASIAAGDLHCQSWDAQVDTAGFTTPVGEPGEVTVTVTCTVGMADLLAPGLPGAVTVDASFTSPVDSYRER